ncbi:ATP-binding protein [Pseudoalteromonas xiamenensis]
MMRNLSLQVFLWFWLTILSMVLLIAAFGTLHSDELRTRPLPPHIVDNLEHLAKNMERKADGSEEKLAKLLETTSYAKHRWLYLSHPDIDKSLSSRPNVQRLDLSQLYYDTPAEPILYVTERFSAQGPAAIHVGETTYQLYQIMPHREPPFWIRMRIMPWWEKLIAILLPSVLFSWWFSLRLTKPIQVLTAAAKEFARGKLSARVRHKSRPQFELAQLSNEFNDMAQRIEDSMTTQKRLLGDVSHELRSPLTRLLLACGLLESGLNEQQTKYLQRIVKEANSLEEMLQNVLTLSRLEGQNQMLEFSVQSLRSVLHDVLADASFEAQSANKTLSVNCPESLEVNCDSILFSSAVENIIRNAIKYANHQIEFTAITQNENLVIMITDDGPGASEEVLQKLCEPFYRTSESRSRDSGGIGLGLAIAHRAVLAHKGELILSQANPHGLTATITVPLNSKYIDKTT